MYNNGSVYTENIRRKIETHLKYNNNVSYIIARQYLVALSWSHHTAKYHVSNQQKFLFYRKIRFQFNAVVQTVRMSFCVSLILKFLSK